MRNVASLLIILLVFMVSAGFAQEYRQELNQFRQRIAVEMQNRDGFQLLTRAALDIDYCSKTNGNIVYVYATPEEEQMIQDWGFKTTPAPDIIGEDTKEYAFHTYDTLTSDLAALANQYPNIARVESLGKSVQGREIWALKISDNVGQDEAEPEVKYVSTMHGDEVVGMEMLVYLARLLLEEYGKDGTLTALVNDLEIWLIPDMNPDGTAAKRRYNANYVDLNRNFPDPQSDTSNDPTGRAIEVQHMIKFNAAHTFCSSLNFHGGALVVNYIWDTMPGDAPDINLIKHLALGYSQRNPPMYKSTSFPNGITNGYDWYEVNGGMQDWNYHWYADMDFTIEISNTKWPNADTLPQYWEENRDSLLWFLSQTRRGIRGTVTDSVTGKPVQAKVDIVEIGKPVFSSKLLGDYHRPLLAGTYTVKATASGYKDAVYNNISVADSETNPTILHIKLQPTAK